MLLLLFNDFMMLHRCADLYFELMLVLTELID
jgi:hypothetical protein